MKYKDLIPKMTSNTTPSGVCSASSNAGNNYLPFYAFDKDYGYDPYTWATTQALPQWICYQFPEPKCVRRLVTVNRNEDSVSSPHNRAVSSFIFQGSNDGTNWTDLEQCTSPSSASHYKNTYDIENEDSYSYYRLYITGNFNNATGTGCGFAEIEMYDFNLGGVAGDIDAIRDWFNSTRFCKDDINIFFKQYLNDGLNPYYITINGKPNELVTITGDTSQKEYEIMLGSSGKIKALLFFDLGEDITAICDGITVTKTLTDRVFILKFASYEETVLWDYVTDNNNAILFGGATYSLTLHDDVSNYDRLIFQICQYRGDSADAHVIIPIKLLPEGRVPNNITIGTGEGIWKDRCAHYTISGTTINKVADDYGSHYGNSMGAVKVIGVNMAFSETLLWDYVTDNAGSIVYGTTPLTLRDDIENYDSLIIEAISYSTDSSSSTWNSDHFFEVPVHSIINARTPNTFAWTSYSDRSSGYTASGRTLQKTAGTNNINGTVKVWGIKY